MNLFAVTMDVDWAPDFAIEYAAEILAENGIKASWFITHSTPQLELLRKHNHLFELGIHPNFLKSSSHGSDEDSVLKQMTAIVPEARAVRTHALVQSTPLLYKIAADFGIHLDVSLFLPDTPCLQPHTLHLHNEHLVRLPYFWEDDVETYNPSQSWNIASERYQVPGLKIFNFHPLLVYLNCRTMDGYEKLKKQKHLPDLTADDCAPVIERDAGTNTLLQGLIRQIKEHQGESFTVSELAALWKKKGETTLKL